MRSRVGPGENALALVLEHEVLVLELLAEDALPARAVLVREVAALAHEARDHAVERRALVPEPLLHRAQRAEVLRRLGRDVAADLHDDLPRRLAADVDVEEALELVLV